MVDNKKISPLTSGAWKQHRQPSALMVAFGKAPTYYSAESHRAWATYKYVTQYLYNACTKFMPIELEHIFQGVLFVLL